jgi:alpha-glucosidase (family GH31 glycosyl hydrolase)
MVAPVTAPAQAGTTRVEKRLWFPAGRWVNFFTGESFAGPEWTTVSADLEDIPVFARPGAIIPLGPLVGWGGLENPATLDVHVFPGADHSFELYEDDGGTTDYQRGQFCITRFSLRGNILTIHPAEGVLSLVPAKRTYRIHLCGISPETFVSIPGSYNPNTRTLSLEPFRLASNESHSITFLQRSQEPE